MRTEIKKWGNSAALRIPTSILEEVSARIDQPVEVTVRKGCIIIEPISAPTLAALIDAITPENLHPPADFGAAVGKESL
jgi:antitoxin MazE